MNRENIVPHHRMNFESLSHSPEPGMQPYTNRRGCRVI